MAARAARAPAGSAGGPNAGPESAASPAVLPLKRPCLEALVAALCLCHHTYQSLKLAPGAVPHVRKVGP